MDAFLILQDGHVFRGDGFAADIEFMGPIAFHTAMTHHTELLTDPRLAGQALVFSYPLIGNVGFQPADGESPAPAVAALIVSELCRTPSNFRAEEPLHAVLERYAIPGISGIDIRSLVRLLREKGTMCACVTRNAVRAGDGLEATLAALRSLSLPDPQFLYKGTSAVYNPEGKATVAVLDTGLRRSLRESLTERGLRVAVYPAETPAEAVLAAHPGGILLPEGPGDPRQAGHLIQTVKTLLDSKLPILGIGYGHQLLALAHGFSIEALPVAHRGANHAVRNTDTGEAAITSQNHAFAVTGASISPDAASLTHVHVSDGSAEGIAYHRPHTRGLQFNPDECPLPSMRAIMDDFARSLEVRSHA